MFVKWKTRISHISLIFILISSCFLQFCKINPDKENSLEVLIEKRQDCLLAIMTLGEKIGQMSQTCYFDEITGKNIT